MNEPGPQSVSALAAEPRESGSRGASTADADLVLLLTLVLLLLRFVGPWPLRIAVTALAVAGLVEPRLRTSRWLWLALAGFQSARIVVDWPLPDNHAYLLAYWCFALFLAQLADRPVEVRAAAARWLLGLCFAFAILWKAFLSPDFVDGRFFRVTLHLDPRFEPALQTLGGLSIEEIDANRNALAPPPVGVEPLDWPGLHEPEELRRLATALTWFSLVSEGLVALLFLSPLPARLMALRHAALLAFCVGTYLLAPVSGFGWLLLILGLAHAGPSRRWRIAYLIALGLVLVYSQVPWDWAAR